MNTLYSIILFLSITWLHEHQVYGIGYQDFFIPYYKIDQCNVTKEPNVRRKWEDFNLRSRVYPEFSSPKAIPNPKPANKKDLKIGIVGGGMAGLTAGLYLNMIEGIKFTIFESDSKRVGGRINTHYFSDEKWDFGEFGAMRMPHVPEYQRVFDLIDLLNEMNYQNPKYHIKLTDFTLANDRGLVFVNNRYGPNGKIMNFSYAIEHPKSLGFPAFPDPPNIWEFLGLVMEPFLSALEKDFDSGMEFLSQTNEFSVKDYITKYLLSQNYPRDKIESVLDVAEVLAFGTGILQTAFSEAVIDTFEFRAAKFSTIDFGMQTFPNSFLPIIGDHIKLGSKVKSISITEDERVQVRWVDISKKKTFQETFDHVIITVPFPVLYHMDLEANISFVKRKQIREMTYDSSCKILLKFSERFWEKGDFPIFGGASTTDLPIRTIVYPSFGMSSKGPGVLLSSYTFATDAIRWGGVEESVAIQEALEQVSIIHGNSIKKLFVEGKMKCWNNEPNSLGGYAWLMPGMFPFYRDASQMEANHKLHFGGEHTSPFHGWINGAVESAERCIKEILDHENIPSSSIFK